MAEPKVCGKSFADFKAEDLDNPALVTQLLAEIDADPSILDQLPDDQLLRVQKLVSPFGTVPESSMVDRWTCMSFVNMSQEYMKKLLITASIGYLYRRCDEYGRKFKDTVENMDDMAAAEAQVIKNQGRLVELEGQIIAAIKERDALAARVAEDTPVEEENKILYNARKTEMVEAKILELRDFASALIKAKDDLRLKNKEILNLEEEMEAIQGFGKRFIIRQFLDDQFRFNPDKHVRSSYVKTNAKSATPGSAYIDKFTPPDDTFHNLQYYLDSNYEELRGVTNRIYRTTPSLEVALLPYADFGSEAEANAFVDRNKDGVIADIRTLRYGKWNFVEAFKANRDKVEAYRGTVVEDILNQIRDDTKIGAELVKNKATRRARETLKELGPAPKAVQSYMAEHAPADNTGVVSSETKEEEAKRIYDAHQEEKKAYECALLKEAEANPAPHDSVRVNVYTMRGGGATTDTSHILTKAVAPNVQQMHGGNSSSSSSSSSCGAAASSS